MGPLLRLRAHSPPQEIKATRSPHKSLRSSIRSQWPGILYLPKAKPARFSRPRRTAASSFGYNQEIPTYSKSAICSVYELRSEECSSPPWRSDEKTEKNCDRHYYEELVLHLCHPSAPIDQHPHIAQRMSGMVTMIELQRIGSQSSRVRGLGLMGGMVGPIGRVGYKTMVCCLVQASRPDLRAAFKPTVFVG